MDVLFQKLGVTGNQGDKLKVSSVTLQDIYQGQEQQDVIKIPLNN
tara:strand:+ start:563 stop:697 length:135 start_codon:yes stop_codon:yes gene_type:complete